MAFYTFNEQDAIRFANKYAEGGYRHHGSELIFRYCPYCHGGDKQERDKFAINLNTGQFYCFRASCGAKGNMLTLARDFDFSISQDVDEYYSPRKIYRRLSSPKKPLQPQDTAISYLRSRGISEEIARKYEIVTDKRNDNVLVFPFYDDLGKLQFIKYRKMDYDPSRDKSKEWCEKNCKPILFGMKQCHGFDRVVITEGQLDSLSVAESGIENAVSVPTGAKGFTWIPYCWDWINKFKEIIVFGDYEHGSMTLLDDIRRRFSKKNIKYVRPENYKGCKDANEILQKFGKQAVADAVNNAMAVPINRVLALQDVDVADFSKILKLSTGIRKLDGLLGGGIPFGTVCLITGKRGDGKSCFASNLMVEALEQGHIIFIYSGEMRKEYIKRSICFQAAGRNHIIENNSEQFPKRFVSNRNLALINRWMTDRAFVYDSDIVVEDEREDLIATIEKSIIQNGSNVILIDNLMTAMYIDEVKAFDKYDRQGKFVRSLTRLAIKYNVLILLVAHRRKSSMVTDANDEVSGSADITNLSGEVISYDRGRPQDFEKGMEESQRRLILSKNRLFGKLELDGIILSYDDKSTRIYAESDKRDYEYAWTKETDGWLDVDSDMELPFITD